MTIPAVVPVRARRNAYYGEEYQFRDADGPRPLHGFSASAELRLYGAQPGAALARLGPVVANVEGVWISDPANGFVQMRIEQATLRAVYDALAPGLEPGAPVLLAWDLLMTGPGGERDVWLEGVFTIEPGVTVV